MSEQAPFLLDCHVDTLMKVVDDGASLFENPSGQLDIRRLKASGTQVVFFACFVEPEYMPDRAFARAEQMALALREQVALHGEHIEVASRVSEIRRITESGKIAAVLGVEGGHAIEEDLGKLRALADLGVRYMTLVWNNHLSWVESCRKRNSDTPVGLTSFGCEVVEAMAQLGMVADLSHASPATVDDVLALDVPPPICTHSGAAAIHEHPRNLSDEQLEKFAARGSAVGLCFVPGFLGDAQTASLDTALQHAAHILDRTGGDLLGIGSDFDGIDRGPIGLEDAGRTRQFFEALCSSRQLGPESRRGIAHENLLRVFAAWE